VFWIAGRIAALISPADMLSTRFIRRLWRSVPSKAEVKPMCASGYAALRSENIAVIRCTAGSQRATTGTAAGQAGAGEA
jgi:hypothetical protein